MYALTLVALACAAVSATPITTRLPAPTHPITADLGPIVAEAKNMLDDPTWYGCHAETDTGKRYACTPNALQSTNGDVYFTSTQAQTIFNSLKAQLTDKPLVAQSVFHQDMYTQMTFNFYPDAFFYRIGYGKGCDWRNYAPADKQTGRLLGPGQSLGDYQTYKFFDHLALREDCVWFELPGNNEDTDAPAGAQGAIDEYF
jgi:hypothetical protein